MTEQEIKETAKLMEEGKLDLKDWLEKTIDRRMREAGSTPITKETQTQQGTTPISGTITFLKGDSAKKAREFYQRKKDKE